MIPLTLSSPSLNRLVFFTSRRYSHAPFLCNFNSLPLIHRKLPYNQLLGVRCEASSSGSSSFTAKPSKEIRKAARAEVAVDEKLSALRQQFSKPGAGIDAYIIPSQDAHQVLIFFLTNSWIKRENVLLDPAVFAVITVSSMCFMNIMSLLFNILPPKKKHVFVSGH